MTSNEFVTLCAQHYIDPNIALESEAVKQGLRDGDDERVKTILEEEF